MSVTLQPPPKRKYASRCAVPNCTDVQSVRHRFPVRHNIALAKLWLKQIKNKKFDSLHLQDIYNRFSVCSQHFTEDCFYSGPKGKAMLKKNVWPTLHLPPAEPENEERMVRENEEMNMDTEYLEIYCEDDEEYIPIQTLLESMKPAQIELNARGELAPVFTPFHYDDNKTINFEIIKNYATYLYVRDIKGVVVNSLIGEVTSMTIFERRAVVKAWVTACAEYKQSVIVQIGGTALPYVLEMAKYVERLKVQAILCLPDLYNKPKTAADLINYLFRISEAAPNTPLIYYHIPSVTDVNINMPEFLVEANGKLDTLVGLYFASTDLVEGTECLHVCKSKYVIFYGIDELLAAAYFQGFDSSIVTTFNIFAELCMKIPNCFVTNVVDVLKVKSFQKKLTKNITNIKRHGEWVTVMKAAMNVLTSMEVGPVREPLLELTDLQKQQLFKDVISRQ